MVLPIVKYGHPALRRKGARVTSLTPEIRQLITDLYETMHEAKGVGLAAQQVGEAVQLAVIDVRGVEDRPSTLELDGQPADVAVFMPLVLINPEIKPVADPVVGPEGCLSFPEIYFDVSRPEAVEVTALNADGERIQFRCGGLLARAVQHETDHLHGILFIDRIPATQKDAIRADIEKIRAETQAELKRKPL